MGRARLTRTDAVQEMAVAIDIFRSEALAALEGLDMDIRRALEWIHSDRHDHWHHEVRRGWDRITASRLELQQARTARRVGDHEPACADEKKALARAQKRLETAQEKVQAVQRSIREIDDAVNDYRGARTPLAGWLDAEAPKAIASLKRMMDHLETYLAMQAAERRVARPIPLPSPVTSTSTEKAHRGSFNFQQWCRRIPCRDFRGFTGRSRMRLWDLSGGAAKLELARKILQTKAADIGEAWSDEPYERFVESYLEPIEPRMKTMIAAIHRLSEVLSAAERACRDESN